MGASYYGEYERAFVGPGVWKLVFSLLPHTCSLTGRSVWLKRAWVRSTFHNSPGGGFTAHEWHDEKAHLVWLLSDGTSTFR